MKTALTSEGSTAPPSYNNTTAPPGQGQPVAAAHQHVVVVDQSRPAYVAPASQGAYNAYGTGTGQQQQQAYMDDDPSCMYIMACFAVFIPLVGMIGCCAFNCGSNLGPRKSKAFPVLVICTVIGMIIGIIYYAAAYS